MLSLLSDKSAFLFLKIIFIHSLVCKFPSALASPALAEGLVIQIPGILNHKVEVLVVVNRATNVVVVLYELRQSDGSVLGVRVLEKRIRN